MIVLICPISQPENIKTQVSQLYVGNLKGRFIVKQKTQKVILIGEVREISAKEISLKTYEGYRLIQVEDFLSIQLLEEVTYE